MHLGNDRTELLHQRWRDALSRVRRHMSRRSLLVPLRTRSCAIGAEALSELATPDRAGARPYLSQRHRLTSILDSSEPDGSTLIIKARIPAVSRISVAGHSPARKAVCTVGRTASASSSADVFFSRLHWSAAPVIAQLTIVAFRSGF